MSCTQCIHCHMLEMLITLIQAVYFEVIGLIFIGLVKAKKTPTKENTAEFTKMLGDPNKMGIKMSRVYPKRLGCIICVF